MVKLQVGKNNPLLKSMHKYEYVIVNWSIHLLPIHNDISIEMHTLAVDMSGKHLATFLRCQEELAQEVCMKLIKKVYVSS